MSELDCTGSHVSQNCGEKDCWQQKYSGVMKLLLGSVVAVACMCLAVPLSFRLVRNIQRHMVMREQCLWQDGTLLAGNTAPSTQNGDCFQMRCVPFYDGSAELVVETCSSIGVVSDEQMRLPFPQCCPYPDIEENVVDDIILTNNYDDE